MKPVDQTQFQSTGDAGIRGNCMAACVASLFEMPLADIPNFCAEPAWPDNWEGWLAERGLYAIRLTPAYEPPGLHIVAGTSPRGSWTHAVIGRGTTIVHDPHPSRAGLVEIVEREVIVPLDPTGLLAESRKR